MRLTDEAYFQAALDRADEARLLYDERHYVFAHYAAGLAVECMFRAYAVRNGNGAEFDARHDLSKWFELARFDEVSDPSRLEKIATAYQTVVLQWSNTQRYYSDGFLRAHFRNNRFDRGIKGNVVKELTRRIVEAAVQIVTEGRLRWTIKSMI